MEFANQFFLSGFLLKRENHEADYLLIAGKTVWNVELFSFHI